LIAALISVHPQVSGIRHHPSFPPCPLKFQVSVFSPDSFPSPSFPSADIDFFKVNRKNGAMKTTLVLPDDIFRQAKARAALKGQSFGKFLEQGLRQMLEKSDEAPSQASLWVRRLPQVSAAAAAELEKTTSSPDFRQVDETMW